MTEEITFEIPQALYKRLVYIVDTLGMSIDEIVEEALSEYAHSQDIKDKE